MRLYNFVTYIKHRKWGSGTKRMDSLLQSVDTYSQSHRSSFHLNSEAKIMTRPFHCRASHYIPAIVS